MTVPVSRGLLEPFVFGKNGENVGVGTDYGASRYATNPPMFLS